MTETEIAQLQRAPGRPRDERAHRAILDAALERFIAEGYEAMSMEAIAADAGVGKATIYRRWHSKAELVSEAIGGLAEDIVVPDTGSVRADLIRLASYIHESAGSTMGRCFGRMVGEMDTNPELGQVYWDNVILPRRRLLRSLFKRGLERGELRHDLDLDLAVDMLAGPVILRRNHLRFARDKGEVDRSFIERMVDYLLGGMKNDVQGPGTTTESAP